MILKLRLSGHGVILAPAWPSLLCWGTEEFEDARSLIDLRPAWEHRLLQEKLPHDAADRPHIKFSTVVRRLGKFTSLEKKKLWRPGNAQKGFNFLEEREDWARKGNDSTLFFIPRE